MAEYTVFYIVLFAEIHEALDSSVGGDVLRGRCIDMDQYVTVMSGQEAGGLYGTHVIIGVDAGDILVFPFYGDNGNLKVCQFPGGQCVAQDNEAFNLIGQKLLNVLALRLCVLVADEYQKLVSVRLICGKDLIQHF